MYHQKQGFGNRFSDFRMDRMGEREMLSDNHLRERRMMEERQMMKERQMMEERRLMEERLMIEERRMIEERLMMEDRQKWGWKQDGRPGGMGRNFNEYNKKNRMDNGAPISLMDLKLGSFEDQFTREPWNQRSRGGGNFNTSQTMPFNRGNARKKTFKNPHAMMKEIFATANVGGSPYYCLFCKHDPENAKGHTEHLRSPGHFTAESKRKSLLNRGILDAFEESQKEVQLAQMNGARLNFCSMCFCHYPGQPMQHKRTPWHKVLLFNLKTYECKACDILIKNRFLFEQHLVSWRHVRNRIYKLNEQGKTDYDDLDFPEEYDGSVDVGTNYVKDVRAHYCKVCQEYFVGKEMVVAVHCKSRDHYDKFRVFAEEQVVERAKLKEEKAKQIVDEAEQKGDEAEQIDDEAEQKDGEEEDQKQKESEDEGNMDEDEVNNKDEEME